MKKKFSIGTASNAVAPAAPASVWGYKGVPGKGGKTKNSIIVEHKNEKESK